MGCIYFDEYVIVGGYIDSWDIVDGVMDDGGGVFVFWEVVWLIYVLGFCFFRIIWVVLWINEENGVRGVEFYVDNYVFEFIRYSIVLEFDVGIFFFNGIFFVGFSDVRRIFELIGGSLLLEIGFGNVFGVLVGEDVFFLNVNGVLFGSLNVEDVRCGSDDNNFCFFYSYVLYLVFDEDNFFKSGYFWYYYIVVDIIDKLFLR